MQAGADFQNRIGAWLATLILADTGARTPWDLPSDVILTSLRSETDRPADDLMVTTSANGQVFIQAKLSLSLGDKDKELTSTMDQFVRQFLIWRDDAILNPNYRHSELAIRHRLVLGVSEGAPNTIKNDLQRAASSVAWQGGGTPA